MREYKRYGLVLKTLEGRMLACPLPLRLISDPRPTNFDVRDVLIPDKQTETGYIVNYTGYYVVCPSCMDRVVADPPESAPAESPVVARGDEGEELGRSPAGFTIDLTPCPQCYEPAHALSVLIRSEDQGAKFLHPTRLYPSELEKQVRVAEFGTITMQDYRAADYKWIPMIRAADDTQVGGVKKLLRKMTAKSSPWQKFFKDENGEFEVGPLEERNEAQIRQDRKNSQEMPAVDLFNAPAGKGPGVSPAVRSKVVIPLHELDVELDDI